MRKIERIVAVLCVLMPLYSCMGVRIFEPIIEEMASDEIPQSGGAISFQYDYVISETKFRPEYRFYPFKYRIEMDGDLYASGECYSNYPGEITVPVYMNDSHTKRMFKTFFSRATDKKGTDWEEWQEVGTNFQSCLGESSPIVYPEIEKKSLIAASGVTVRMNVVDNSSGMALRYFWGKGSDEIRMTLSEDHSSITGNYSDLCSEIPLIQGQVTSGPGLYMFPNGSSVIGLYKSAPESGVLLAYASEGESNTFMKLFEGDVNQVVTFVLKDSL